MILKINSTRGHTGSLLVRTKEEKNALGWGLAQPVSCENLSGREKISASRDFTVCIMRCVYRAELILGR